MCKKLQFIYLIAIGIISIFYSESIIAQGIGINNTTPAASSVLDIASTNKGLLVPRLALTATNVTTPVTAPATSLLVFNTATAGIAPNNVIPGYYFWDGLKWVRLKTSADNTEWSISGNTGTNASTNFIGTTDAQDLTFRVNNFQKMKLFQKGRLELYGDAPDSSTIYIGKNAGVNNTNGSGLFIGKETAPNNTGASNTFIGHTAGRANTSGFKNVFTGFQAGLNNSTGRENTFIGSGAGQSSTTGNTNTFVGNGAGFSNLISGSNTMVGADAGSKSTGNTNSFFGSSAAFNNLTGNSNTFIGNHAAFNNTTGSGNAFVGDSAGSLNTTGNSNVAFGSAANFSVGNLVNASAIGAFSRVDANNSMVLGSVAGVNGATTTVNVGIGTTAPKSRLDVVGSIATAITTTTTNLTLNETHHTVIIFGTHNITLPAPNTCLGRIYIIVNQTGTPRTISSYFDFSLNATTLINSNSSITIQSTGGNWSRIK